MFLISLVERFFSSRQHFFFIGVVREFAVKTFSLQVSITSVRRLLGSWCSGTPERQAGRQVSK